MSSPEEHYVPSAIKKAKIDAEHSSNGNNLQSLIYTNDDGKTPKLKVLDQLLVPQSKVYIDVPDVQTAYNVIKTMQIRGTSITSFISTDPLFSKQCLENWRLKKTIVIPGADGSPDRFLFVCVLSTHVIFFF